MARDVVITGMGLVSALAHSPAELFERIGAGLSSVRIEEQYAGCGFPNPASAFISPSGWEEVEAALGEAERRSWAEPLKLASAAAEQALRQSGLEPRGSARKGVFVACNKHGLLDAELASLGASFQASTDSLELDDFIQRGGGQGRRALHHQQEAAALLLSQRYGMDDVVMTHADACAAGGVALGTAFRFIRHGELDVALVGGAESMCSMLTLAGFSVLGAVSQETFAGPATISRPFDKSRAGFVMGEGSAFLVLESLEHARQRQAQVLARILGFAKQTEAWRITSSPPDGSEYARCMHAALADAGLQPADIDHVNAHGTSTRANDGCEGRAIKLVFGERAARLPVTANKSALGHSFGASGSIEAVLSVLSLQRGVLLPTLNFDAPDEAGEGLDIVTCARACPLRTVMSNSFGFGGENCTLIFGAAPAEPAPVSGS